MARILSSFGLTQKKHISISEIFFLLAAGALLLSLSVSIHKQYPLAGDIALYALAVYAVALALLIVFKTVDGILSLLHQSRDKD